MDFNTPSKYTGKSSLHTPFRTQVVVLLPITPHNHSSEIFKYISFHLLEIEFSKNLIIIQLWYLHFTTIFYTACKMTIYTEAAHQTPPYYLPTYLTQHRLDWYLLPPYQPNTG
jgi:hypothetical protein